MRCSSGPASTEVTIRSRAMETMIPGSPSDESRIRTRGNTHGEIRMMKKTPASWRPGHSFLIWFRHSDFPASRRASFGLTRPRRGQRFLKRRQGHRLADEAVAPRIPETPQRFDGGVAADDDDRHRHPQVLAQGPGEVDAVAV